MNKSEEHFSRKVWRSQTTKIARVLYYTGAANYYLDYQVWKAHYRLWHPVTLLLLFVFIILFGVCGIADFVEDFRVQKKNRVFKLKDAKP
jgi:hypothetical protein